MKGTSSGEIILNIKDIICSAYADTKEKGVLVQDKVRASFKIINTDIILDFSGLDIVNLDFLKEVIGTSLFTGRVKGRNINDNVIPLLKEAFFIACQNNYVCAELNLSEGGVVNG